MTESFEKVCASYDHFTWIGRDGVKSAIDRLKAAHESEMAELQSQYDQKVIDLQEAHEHEMEAVRDPQRIGGTLERDSFEYALEQLREFRWQHATNDNDAIPYINNVARAYKQARKAEFHRGYESGVAARDAEQWQLDRKRHKAVCRLREFEPYIVGKPTEEASKLIRCIIGREDCHVSCVNDLEEARDRLIYLLGADTILKEDGDGMARGDFDRGNVPCDSVGARDVPEEAVVDECNFSALESDMDAKDAGQNPAETSEGHSDHVSLDTPSSITDELREWVRDLMPASGTLYIIGGSTLDELYAIADRIDAKHAELRRKLDAVKGIVDGS